MAKASEYNGVFQDFLSLKFEVSFLIICSGEFLPFSDSEKKINPGYEWILILINFFGVRIYINDHNSLPRFLEVSIDAVILSLSEFVPAILDCISILFFCLRKLAT